MDDHRLTTRAAYLIPRLPTGKRPFVASDRDFRFKTLLAAQPEALAPPPNRFGHGLLFPDWLMLGNDKVGDCVPAGLAHQTMLATRLGLGVPAKFTEDSVISWYSDLTGYVPGDETTDEGTEPRAALAAARKVGVPDAAGGRHKIGAFVSIDFSDWDEMMLATYYFSSVGIGTAIPESVWEQFDQHQPWDVVDGSSIDGYHYVPLLGRNARSTAGVVSWGRRCGVTRDFAETYFDEAWAIVFPEELRNGKNERGLDLAALNDLLASLA